jgi:hypothetical protein
MKKIVFVCVLLVFSIGFTGCGSETATGVGIGGGISELLRETIAGADADLARRKAELEVAYAKGVETGIDQEELDEIEKKWNQVVKIEAGKDVGKTLLGFNYEKPESGDITSLVELGIILLGGKKLNTLRKKYKAEKMGIAKALTENGGTVDAKTVYGSIAAERKALKLPTG